MAFSNVGVNITINATNAQAGAQQAAQAYAAIQNAISPLSAAINGLNGQMGQLVSSMQRTGNQARNTAATFATFAAANIAARAVTELAGALNELIVGSTLYAARTEELGVALNAVARAGGVNIEVIKQQEFSMRQLNITTQDARQALSRFLQANLDITKSGALARTAQDLAVIAGVSTSEEINKLIIGIQTLQSRNLRTAGVFITVDEVLDNLAKTTHRARDSFSTLEKQQATLNAVLEFGTRVTGTYEAAMTTASKQMRSLERVMFEMQNSIGAFFVPTMLSTITTLTDLFTLITKYPGVFLTLTSAALGLAAAFAVLNTSALPSLVTGLTSVLSGIRNVGAAMTNISTILSEVPIAARLLGASFNGITVAANGLTAATETMQLAMAGILGWGAIAAVIGVVAYSLYNAVEAQKDFLKISDSSIVVGAREIESLNARAKALDNYKNSSRAIAAAQPAIDILGNKTSGYEITGTNFESSNKDIASINKDLEGLERRKDVLVKEIAVVQQRGASAVVDRSYDQVNKLQKELTDVQESISIQTGNLSSATSSAEKFGAAFATSKQNLQDTASALGITVAEAARFRDMQTEEVNSLKITNSELSKQYAILRDIENQHERVREAIRLTIVAEEEKLKSTGRDIVFNLQLAESNDVILQSNLKAAQAGQREAAGFGFSLTSLGQNVRQFVQDMDKAQQMFGLPTMGLGKKASEGFKSVQDEAVADLEKAQAAATDNTAQFDLFAASLDSVRSAYQKLHPESTQNKIGTEASTEALYKYLGGYDKLKISLPQFTSIQDRANEALKRTAASAREAAFGVQTLEDAVKDLKFPTYDQIGGAGRAAAGAQSIKEQMGQELERQKRVGAISGNVNELPVRFYPEFIENTEAVKAEFELIRKKFGGSIDQAIAEAYKDPQLLEKLGVTLSPEDAKTLLGTLKGFYDASVEAAKKADNQIKDENERLRDSLKKIKDDVQSFLDVGSENFKLRIELEEAERTKKDLESIMTLRRQMGIPLDLPIKLENVQRMRAELEVLKSVFDEIRKANNEILEARLRVGAPVVPAEVRAQQQLLKLVQDRRNEEQQMAADIAVAINKRIQLETNAADTQKLQAAAFLDALKEEQSVREGVVTAFTKLQITEGNFSFADNNKIIQEGLKTANSPVVTELNNTQKVIEKGVEEIKKSQADFSLAIGNPLSNVKEILDRVFNNHVEVRDKQTEHLATIAANTAPLLNMQPSGGTPAAPTGLFGSLGGPFSASVTSSSGTIDNLYNILNTGGPRVEQPRYSSRWAGPASTFNIIPSQTGGPRVEQPRYSSRWAGPASTFNIIPSQADLKARVAQEATKRGIPVGIALAQIEAESSWDIHADSGKARGLAQFTKGTAARYGLTNRDDPEQSIVAWGNYMSDLLKMFKGRMDLAIAAYNSGEGNVMKYGGIPPFKETQNYMRRIGSLAARKYGSAFSYAQSKAPASAQAAAGGDEYGFGDLFGDVLGNLDVFRRLNIPFDSANIQRFAGTKLGQQSVKESIENITALKNDIELRQNKLDILKGTTQELDALHRQQLELTRDEELEARAARVRFSNDFQIKENTAELNRLYKDQIAIKDVLDKAELARGEERIAARQEEIRLIDEINRRSNAELRKQDTDLLLLGVATSRGKTANALEDDIFLLENDAETQSQKVLRIHQEAYKARLESAKSMQEEIARIEEERANRDETLALEYQLEWTRAIDAVKEQHIDAVKSILRSQAELDNQNVFDPAKVRAKVLEGISQVESVNDSVAGLFNSTFKVYTDDIDKWIDKTSEKMGNLGKIFNGFFKSVAHRAIGSIESSILDSIFPPTREEQEAKSSDASGIFNGSAKAIATLGLTSDAVSREIAVGTNTVSTSMVRVSYAAESAAASLMRLASVGGVGNGVAPSVGNMLPVLGIGGSGAAGGSSSAVGTILRGVQGLGFGGLGTSGSTSGNIFSRAVSNPFVGAGFAGGNPLTALLSLSKNLPLSTTDNFLPTLSGGTGQKGLVGKLLSSLGLGGTGGFGGLLSKSGLGKLGLSLGAQAPLMGLGIGASLGGGGLGSVIGGLGGGLAGLGLLGGLGASGLIGGAATASTAAAGLFGAVGLGGLSTSIGTAFGTTGSLATLGSVLSFAVPAAIIAAPLIAAAIIIGKNKARQAAERTRNQMSLDINARLTEILNDVKSNKMQGPQALAAAEQAFKDYRDNMATIKDSKTRRHAEIYITSREHPPLLIMDKIKEAVAQQKRRQEVNDMIIPTYAYGGTATSTLIGVSYGEKLRHPSFGTYQIPGRFDAKDSLLARVPIGTKIESPIQNIYNYAVGGVAGVAPARVHSTGTSGGAPSITVINVMSAEEAEKLHARIPDSYIAGSVIRDIAKNPNGVPSAVMKALEY